MSSYAWVTLVMRDELYACGALVLGQSLRRAGTQADLVCMVTDEIPADVTAALGEVWDHVVCVPRLEARRPVQQRRQVRFGGAYSPWLQCCLTKFCCLQMTQYRKLAFLDADMLCVATDPSSSSAASFSADAAAAACESKDAEHKEEEGGGIGSEELVKPGAITVGCEGAPIHPPPSPTSSSPPSHSGREGEGVSGQGQAAHNGESVDALFALQAPAGILDLYRADVELNSKRHGGTVPAADVRRALEGNYYAVRGCLLLLQPSLSTWQEIAELAASETIGHRNAMAGPDEYFITEFFLARGIPWTHVHMRYGSVSWNAASTLKGAIAPVFLHYVSDKPWVSLERIMGSAAGGSASRSSGGGSSAAGSATNSVAGGSAVRNWSDYGLWDGVAAEVVAALQRVGGEEAEAGRRLFAGWRRRVLLPVEENG